MCISFIKEFCDHVTNFDLKNMYQGRESRESKEIDVYSKGRFKDERLRRSQPNLVFWTPSCYRQVVTLKHPAKQLRYL